MKNNIGTIVSCIGLLCTMCSLKLFNDQILEYSFGGLGVLLAIAGAFIADRERKKIKL